MNLWRLERLRLTRTRRWIAPLAIYLLFGLIGPLTARYLGEILASFGGFEVLLPDPTPREGFAQYVSNVSQLGVLSLVVVSAGALAVDHPPEMGVFLRTRVSGPAQLVLPRVVVLTALAVGCWTLGTLAAWYETVVLLGAVRTTAVLVGLLYGALYLVLVVAIVAAIASRGGPTLATTMQSVGVLIGLPVLAIVPPVERWVPSELVGALDASVGGAPLTDPLPAALVAAGAIVVLLWLAVRRVATTEI